MNVSDRAGNAAREGFDKIHYVDSLSVRSALDVQEAAPRKE